MKPCCYESIGNCQTKLNVKPGFSLGYSEGRTTLKIETDRNLQNPSLATNFRLAPGKLDLTVAGGKVSKFVLRPDLEPHNASLEIFPLEGGQFNFKISKKCPASGFGIILGYSSSNAQGYVTFKPKYKLPAAGFKVNSQFTFNGVSDEHPIVLVDHIRADYKNFRLCSCYNKQMKEWRGAIFADLHKANLGALLHFGKEKIVTDVDIFAQTFLKGFKLAAIASVLSENKTVKVNAEGQLCEHARAGAKLTFAGKTFNGKAGLSTCVRGFDVDAVVSAAYNTAFTLGLDAQVKVPLHGFGKGTLGLKLADVTKAEYGIRFDVELKQ